MRLELRCTEDDKRRWQEKADAAGVSLSELVRTALDKARVPDKRGKAERTAALREVAKIGNNLNQIAKWANTYKTSAEAVAVVAHLVAIEQEVEHVLKSLSER